MSQDFMNDRKKIIYLATPYTHKDKAIEQKRFEMVTRVSGLLIKEGVINFSPITQSHEQNRMVDLPGTWEFWKSVDTEFLHRCDELHVLVQEGWSISVGVLAEIEIMAALKKPIRFLRYVERTGELVYIDVTEAQEKR